MFFGLFKSKTPVEAKPSVPEGPIRNLRLENAIANFLKLSDGNNLIINKESIRLGSLSIIAHSNKDEVLKAIANLKNNGSIQAGQEATVTQKIIKLLSSKESEQAFNRKVREETGMALDHFRAVAESLAKVQPNLRLAA